MTRRTGLLIRNPVLGLPAMQALQDLPLPVRESLATLLDELALDARSRAETSWRRHKAPMAAYWKVVSVYAGHVRRALLSQPERTTRRFKGAATRPTEMERAA